MRREKKDRSSNGALAGYAASPRETIYKPSGTGGCSSRPAQRVRMNNLAVSVVGLVQGIPFFHAGEERLRSKSFGGDSYDGGVCREVTSAS